MVWGLGFIRRGISVVAACAFALAAFWPTVAVAETAPHVATSADTDTCAMCHRTHTAAGSFGWADTTSQDMTASALGLALPSDAGDTALCYVCHGIEALGSATQVQWSFLETSTHSLAPSDAPYGPARIECSSCHDAHGTAEITTGVPYPALLRSRTSTGTRVYQAEEYCATCHADRPLDRYDGLGIYRQTGHYTELPDPANGTKIRCSNCHVAHGSAIGPLIVSEIASPALAATATITANDRTLCFACHPDPYGTYPGEVAYPVSAHASSAATVAISGEWPEAGSSRLVGECQVCHAPMGSVDASGNLIPKLAELEGRALCDQCHDADGPASTDVSATAYPMTAAADLELLVAIAPTSTTAAQGRLAVYGTEATSTVPRALLGVREYRLSSGIVGDMSTGDIDGDGEIETVVTHTDAAVLTIFEPDTLKGIKPMAADQAIAAGAEFVLVADVLGDVNALPEVIAVDANAGDLRVYRWNGSALAQVGLPFAVGNNTSGIAAGDCTGGLSADIVLTDSVAKEFRIFTETGADQLGSTTISIGVQAGPRGPSIGDVWGAAGVEIAIANSGETSNTVSVFNGIGTLLGHKTVNADLVGGARAWDTLIADVLPGTAGAELSVAVNGGVGLSSINVFEQAAGTLAAPQRDDTGIGYATGSLASGDIDGDGRNELVAGNGGWWSRLVANAKAPSVQVFNHNVAGNDLTGVLTKWSGGVELAGAPPALALADLGGVGPTRHPVGAVADSHNSTETPAFTRHVECVDCHDPHEATSTVAAAPAVFGQLKGVFGTSLVNNTAGANITYDDAQPVANEYEVCFKCHSGYSSLEGGRNIASEVNTQNASVHAIEETYVADAPTSTFETGWDNDSVLFCSDCHGNADTSAGAVKGAHVSPAAPLLVGPYLGTLPADGTLLCYDCHKESVYLTGPPVDNGTASLFYDGDLAKPQLHSLHVNDHGFGCATCHVSHGSPTENRLMRADTGYALNLGVGGTCENACHLFPGNTYTR
ncbi:MAG: cytochrome c3 family protein [Coriobacteriia bacterium]